MDNLSTMKAIRKSRLNRYVRATSETNPRTILKDGDSYWVRYAGSYIGNYPTFRQARKAKP